MQLYSFRLVSGTRIDVEASTPEAGYNKLNSLPMFKPMLTEYYLEIGHNSRKGKALKRLLMLDERKIEYESKINLDEVD